MTIADGSLAERLQEITAGIDPDVLARELEIDLSYLSKILRGQRPGLKTARKIVQRFPELTSIVAATLLTA